MRTFHPGIYTLIPRDDGSHANDWVTDQFELPEHPGSSVDWPHGVRRGAEVEFRIEVYDGSGSNSWTIRPVHVIDSSVPSDSRVIVDDERACAVGTSPLLFAETDLPIQRLYQLPVRLGALAWKLTRTGAGTNRLRVRLFVSGGVIG